MSDIDYESSENQRILGQLVDKHIYACMSVEVGEMLENNIMNIEDMENIYYYSCPECGWEITEVPSYDETVECPECECESTYDQLDTDVREPLEWWIVSSMFYERLKKKNEIVYDFGCNQYWGRQTSGQAILLDYVIGEIAEDMEILEGQRLSWGG